MSLPNRNHFSLVVLLLISGLALYMRLESVVETQVINPIRADARDYFFYAYNFRINHVYSAAGVDPDHSGAEIKPDSIRPPGYPLFLSLFVNGLPDRPMLGKVLICQAILSALTVVLAFVFFRGFLPEPWALSACFFTAISPHLIVANSYLLTEPLFCFLLVLFAWLASSYKESSCTAMLFLGGLILGFAAIVRTSILYFPIGLAFLFLFEFGWRRGLRFFVTLSLGFFLALAPWLIRNLIVFHGLGDKTQMINFLHHGLYPNFTYDHIVESYGFPYRFDPRSVEISRNVASVVREICERFRREPIEHAGWFVLGKPVAFWSWNIVQGAGDCFVYPAAASPYFNDWLFYLTHELMYFLHWPLVCLGLLGSVLVWVPCCCKKLRQPAVFAARLISLMLAYFTLLHMVGAPFPRYAVPLRPFLYGMSMLAVQTLMMVAKGALPSGRSLTPHENQNGKIPAQT